MTRGRPLGSTKRGHAIGAADAIRAGQFDDIRMAASCFRPAHIGSDEGFRDFVDYVEQELRRAPCSMRVFKILAKRGRNRRVQPSERAKRRAELKREVEIIRGIRHDGAFQRTNSD